MKDSKIWIALIIFVTTFVLGFLAGISMDEDPKPSDSPSDTYQAPSEPTWEEKMLECVQGRQTFYDEDRNFSTAVCSDHLSQQN